MTDLATRVAAVVVNFNAGDHLLECAHSLRGAGVSVIVVADNASIDDSVARLRVADPAALIVETGGNFGYGGGVNRGVAALCEGADVLLVCNPDLVLDPGTVEALLDALDADDGLGLVGPRIDNPDGTLYPSARTFPRLLTRSLASSRQTTASLVGIGCWIGTTKVLAASTGCRARASRSAATSSTASVDSTRTFSCTSKTSTCVIASGPRVRLWPTNPGVV